MPDAASHIHAIGTAVPGHDIHRAFIDWAEGQISGRKRALFRRMAERSGIEHRWSIFPPTPEGGSPVAPGGFYAEGSPPTSARMAVYGEAAPELALAAVAALPAFDPGTITHLVVASCTGFVAPGIDQIIAARLGLAGSVERTLIGFMGCYAAVAALRTAHHIVRSEPEARVLVVTVEISSIHLRPIVEIEPLLAMLLFGDGAAAALVGAEPRGIAIERLFSATLPDSEDLIGWSIGDTGFEMILAGEVPARLTEALGEPAFREAVTGPEGVAGIRHWAVHAGGRTILDAVGGALALDP
ncbi:MAG: type III polyketide synthase, partial [Sphingomonadaceae bacterium]|nr:type III polyketide synthase [Sphingomonadaceae bacterium]